MHVSTDMTVFLASDDGDPSGVASSLADVVEVRGYGDASSASSRLFYRLTVVVAAYFYQRLAVMRRRLADGLLDVSIVESVHRDFAPIRDEILRTLPIADVERMAGSTKPVELVKYLPGVAAGWLVDRWLENPSKWSEKSEKSESRPQPEPPRRAPTLSVGDMVVDGSGKEVGVIAAAVPVVVEEPVVAPPARLFDDFRPFDAGTSSKKSKAKKKVSVSGKVSKKAAEATGCLFGAKDEEEGIK